MGDWFAPERIRTTALQAFPDATNYFRYLAPLYPRAFEALDLSGFDIILSSSSAWAKGVRFAAEAVHVCYLHNVSRFVVDYDGYVGGFSVLGGRWSAFARPIVRRLVAWDREAAKRPTRYIANSRNVAARIAQAYGRIAEVVHPPVEFTRFTPSASVDDYFLVVTRLLGYKRVDLAIDAVRSVGGRLLIVGTGPERGALERRACGSRTEFVGAVSDTEVARLMARARAIIVPGEEDYGLVPLEANASGRPVVAFGRGGALETVIAGRTGAFFAEPTASSLAAALGRFDADDYDPVAIRNYAERFGPEPFKRAIERIIRETAGSCERRALEAR